MTGSDKCLVSMPVVLLCSYSATGSYIKRSAVGLLLVAGIVGTLTLSWDGIELSSALLLRRRRLAALGARHVDLY